MVEPHVVLFLGSDEPEKEKRLKSLQEKAFPPELKEFNYDLLHGDTKELSPRFLKEIFSSFPSEGAKRRMVVIRQAHKLSKACQAILFEECGFLKSRILLVLDVPEVKGTAAFVDEAARTGAQVIRLKNEPSLVNAFDLGRAVAARNAQDALDILSRLLSHKERPEKILGAIFWQWERLAQDKRIKDDVHKRGLKLILEADRRLKSSSSRVAREILILETLVVKLSLA